MPQEYIDQFLLTGSNTDYARTRLAIEYSKQLPMDKMLDFIQKTYHGGYGLKFGETKVSAWYAEDGMHIAYGTGARYARTAQILSWEDMYHRIGELLDQGRFATNVELAEMRTFERKELAEKLWYMDRDINHAENPKTYMSIVRDLRGGFPDDTAKLMVYLSEPESYKAIMDQLYEWRDAYQENPDIMRFRHYRPDRVVPFLEEYAYPRKEYFSDMAEVPEEHPFITEDEINELFTRVGHYSGARDRLYDFYQSPHTPKEKQDYIKNIYGIGGGNCALSRNFHSNEWHDGKGIRLEKPGCTRIELNWRKVAKYYDALMESGRYFTPEQLAEKKVRDAEKAAKAAEEASQKEAEPEVKAATEEPPVWNYNSIKHDHPNEIVLYQVGDFYEIYGEDAAEVAPLLDLTLSTKPVPGAGRTQMCGIPVKDLERFAPRIQQKHSLIVASLEDGSPEHSIEIRLAVPPSAEVSSAEVAEEPAVSEPIPIDPVPVEQPAPVLRTVATQEEIDAAIQAWNGDIASKRAVVRYMEQHGRERSTAAWLQLQYGSDSFSVPMDNGKEMTLSWAKVQRRIAQLMKAERFYTEEEYDRLDNIDPVVIRERLDAYKDGDSPFVEQVMRDVQRISDEEFAREHLIPGETTFEIDGRTFLVDRVNLQFSSVNFQDITFQNATGFPIFRTEPIAFLRRLVEEQEATAEIAPEEPSPVEPTYTIKTEEYISGEKSGLPYDVVFQTISTREPEPPAHVVEAQNFRITDDALGVGGAKAKFRMNMDAIHLLQTLEAENRQATPEEQTILSRYVGWGGLADAFDESKAGWTEEYKELSAALTPQEYSAARSSTLNAHYTSPSVIKAMYDAISRMGFQTGNILEPSMGVGNFFGMLPDQMQNSRLYGVELDSITGRIAKQLYPKANITISGFEKTDRRDFFDLAVGNVPFGQYQVNDPAYNRLGFSIHNYFFAKAMDQLRPGGVMAFVTSRYTMDAKNSDVRKYLAERAQFLGAIRLPNDAFKANAGTEVVSDIIFLQKRDRPIAIEPDWVQTGENKDGYTVNRYFLDNPHMVLGEETSESSRFGQDYTVAPKDGTSLAEQLQEAVNHIHGTYQEAELPDLGEGEEIDTSIPADPDVKNFSYTLVDGEVYYRENSRMVKPQLNATTKERVKGMIGLRECVRELIDLQMDAYIPDSVIQEKQTELNSLYDAFAEKFGLINDRGNKLAFSDDSSYYLLCSLEVLDDDGKMERKADMFTKRTIRQAKVVNSVDTASEALAVSIGERAGVDMAYMEQLTGKTSEELASELRGVIFRLPHITDSEGTPRYVTADEYLSGNVREKLSEAKEAAIIVPELYSDNVVALEAAQPKDLEAHEIDVRLGATWIDKKYIQEFMEDLLDPPYYMRRTIKVNYSPFTAEWNITGKKNIGYRDVNANTTYGTSRINAYQILEDSLNLRDVQIHDVVEDSEGREKRVLNQKETTLAQQKQESIRDAFKDWIWKDPERRQALVQQYNELFNSTRPREYDGSHITFGGMSPEITLREHQQNAIAHILYGGNTLLAHEVGSGKTFEMVAAAMESKRLGLCSKSLIAVPNHLTEQWASEFLRLYPSANILVARKKDFEPARRKTFCAKIATGDYDAIIMGHSQFEKIPISMERQQQLIQQQIWEIEDGLEEMKASGAERFSIKALEKTKKSLETRLKKLLETGRKDDVVTFEQLGVDRLFVDEAHSYKNLFLYTKMRNVAGLSTTDAQKSSDMYMKCRYMDEKTGNRGVIFATGTPVSNSMTELYTMMRYLQHDMLQDRKWSHFDCWASQFGETKTVIELAPEGTGYRARSRFAKFFNLPELINIWKEAADVKTADQLNLPRPTAVYHNEVAQPTAQQKMLVQQLSERAAKVHSGAVKPEEDNMLKITSDGRKLGLDQRIINPNLPDDPGSKVNMCVQNILRIWEDGKADKLTQLVFCDISTPKKPTTAKGKTLDSPEVHALEALAEVPEEKEFTVYDDIRSKLIDAGVPAEQIAFIHDANTDARKKELFGKVRSGQVRVLMGSTFKMGAGMNVQDRLIALHDLDCPWRPGDLEQRSGRIIRQGNMNPEVHIYRYVTEGTFDSYLWQTVENKQKFISQIMTSKSPVRSCEDVDETALSYAEIKALCAGDPRIKEKMDLDIEVSRLKLLKADHQSQQYHLEDNLLKFFPEQVEKYKGIIAGIEKDMVMITEHPHPADGFAGMTVKGDTLTDKDNAGAALLEACKEATGYDPVPIGTYRGFSMTVTLENFGKDYYLQLKGNLSYSVKLGSDARGNLVRIENELAQLPLRLNGTKAQLQNTYTQMENARAEIGKTFPQEAELRQKSERLAELNILLDMDGKGKSQQTTDRAIVAKSDRPSVLDKLKTPAIHGCKGKTHNQKKEER
ncbi:MAG: SNF2-related protein [Oscillospiraceae bacterium]